MTQSTNPAPVLVALVPAKGAPKILSRDLRVAFGVYQELARRAQVDLLPRGLTAEAVRAHLQQHLDEELAHGKATKAQASAVRRRSRLEAQARELRIRLVDLVDASFPSGSPERGDFFPAEQKGKALSQYVLALCDGYDKHGLPGLPADLRMASVRSLGSDLAGAEEARDQAGVEKSTSSTARTNLEPATADIAVRLSKAVRGHYGRSSRELLAYGLKVQTAPIARRVGRKVKGA